MKPEEIKKYVDELLEKGLVHRTGLFVLPYYENFKLDDDNKFLMEDILELYKFYVNSLEDLENYKLPFLKTLLQEETKRNQALEGIDPFLINLFINSKHKSASNIAIKRKLENNDADIKFICQIHKTLLNGLANSSELSTRLRTSNNIFVGKNNIPNKGYLDLENISYLPIDYNDINNALEYILKLYNLDKVNYITEIFSTPILIHGLIASLQIFKDGNTRLARILQNVSFWDLSNKNLEIEALEKPAIYVSEALYTLGKRKEYRDIIKELAINPNNEILNEWIRFNMGLIERQIYLNQDKVKECDAVLKRVHK